MFGTIRRLVAKGVCVLLWVGCVTNVRTREFGQKMDQIKFDEGFALLLVMVVVLTLSVMFGAILESTRQSVDETSERAVRLKMMAALDGALLSTSYNLSRVGRQTHFGAPEILQIGDYAVRVTVRPELSKLDVNYASAESIQRLLEASEIPDDRAAAISASIVAWRNSTSTGVTPQAQAVTSTPSHPFETVADISLVRNGGPDLASCLGPDVTVFTRTASADASYASDRLRRAIYGETQQPQRQTSYNSVVGGEASRPDLYEVTEEASDDSHQITLRRQVIIRVAGDDRRPVWILDQTSPGPDEKNAAAACQRLASHGP